MAIQNLPNYVWVNKGKPDPLTGQIAQTRYAVNLLTGDRLNVRQVQTAAHGGVSYEKRRQQASPTPTPGQPQPAPVQPAPVKQYKLRELSPQGDSILRDYVKTQRAQGDTRTIDEIRRSADWKQLLKELRYKSTKPTSKKAIAIRGKLGRGSLEWDWPLGETPTEEEAA